MPASSTPPPVPPATPGSRGRGAARRARDRRGRGVRGPLAPRLNGTRSPAARFDLSVQRAVDRLLELEAPGLDRVTVLVQEIPDRLEQRLASARAGLPTLAPADRHGSAGIGPDGEVEIRLFRRPLLRLADDGIRDDLVYATLVELAARRLGQDPADLDPDLRL